MLSYVTHSSKAAFYTIDLEEKEPLEKTEKDPLDGKEKTEDWIINTLDSQPKHTAATFCFLNYDEISFISPYFEICPRPPEQNLFS